MANTKAAGVWKVDTTATFTDLKAIKGIKWSGGTSASILDESGGKTLWATASSTEIFDEACIKSSSGVHVIVTAGTLYIYSE